MLLPKIYSFCFVMFEQRLASSQFGRSSRSFLCPNVFYHRKNIHCCANVFGFSTDNLNSGLISRDIIDKHYVCSLSSLDVNCAERFFELILVRDGYLDLNGWTLQDINSMIYILLIFL
jgi:hypothetical protein